MNQRIGVLSRLRSLLGIRSLYTNIGGLDQLPFQENTFDATFCYSAVFFGNWRRIIAELLRVTRPGGSLYVGGNGAIGWYLYNLIEGHKNSEDFSTRRMAWDTFMHTLGVRWGRAFGAYRQSVIPPRVLVNHLEQCGARVEQTAADGRAGSSDTALPVQFFPAKKYGLTGVYEILATKLPAPV